MIFFPFGSPVGCRPGVEPVLPPRTAILISRFCAKVSSVSTCGAAQPRSILSVTGGLGCWDVQRLPVSPKRRLGFAEAPDDALQRRSASRLQRSRARAWRRDGRFYRRESLAFVIWTRRQVLDGRNSLGLRVAPANSRPSHARVAHQHTANENRSRSVFGPATKSRGPPPGPIEGQ